MLGLPEPYRLGQCKPPEHSHSQTARSRDPPSPEVARIWQFIANMELTHDETMALLDELEELLEQVAASPIQKEQEEQMELLFKSVEESESERLQGHERA